MRASQIDELVASLATVRDEQVPGPTTPGAHDLLTMITAERPAGARYAGRSYRHRRWAVAVVAATAMTAAALIGLNTVGSGRISSYANAAVTIERTERAYKVHVKNVFADQREFKEAFAKFGLDVSLQIVPVTPGQEGEMVRVMDLNGEIAAELDCPRPADAACPLTVELKGVSTPKGPVTIMIGRAARPSEVYENQRPGAGDNPRDLRLTGRTVDEALVVLRRRGLRAAYAIGEFDTDGSGGLFEPPSAWRPQDDRRVHGAWLRSSDSVTLLVTPRNGDPAPVP